MRTQSEDVKKAEDKLHQSEQFPDSARSEMHFAEAEVSVSDRFLQREWRLRLMSQLRPALLPDRETGIDPYYRRPAGTSTNPLR